LQAGLAHGLHAGFAHGLQAGFAQGLHFGLQGSQHEEHAARDMPMNATPRIERRRRILLPPG